MWKRIERLLNAEIVPAAWISAIQRFYYQTLGFPALSPRALQLKREFLLDLCLHLRVSCRNGLPVAEAVQALADSNRSPFRRTVLADLAARLRQGISLSTSCAFFPGYFSSFFCRMIQVGEQIGTLTDVLDILIRHYRTQESISRRILATLFYPFVLFMISLALYAGILIFILPRYAELYEGAEAHLPALTKFVLTRSTPADYSSMGHPFGFRTPVLCVVRRLENGVRAAGHLRPAASRPACANLAQKPRTEHLLQFAESASQRQSPATDRRWRSGPGSSPTCGFKAGF